LTSTFLALFLFFSSYGAEAQLRTVDVSTISDHEPFTFGTDDTVFGEMIKPGQDSTTLKGYDWDIVREAYHAMGATIKLNVMPWKQALKMLENGNTDVLFPTTETQQRIEKGFRFSKSPIHTSNQTIYVRIDDPVAWDGDVNSLNAILSGKKVGALLGYSYGTWWDAYKLKLGDRLDENASDGINFKKLERGRLDFVMAYEISADYMLSNEGHSNRFKKIGNVSQTTEHIATYGESGSVKAVDLFDEGYAKIKANGKLAAIKKKWGQ